ncbi:MAG: hypothetical protein ACFE8L_06645 [Candidatus Hodarchaeota archaeon]
MIDTKKFRKANKKEIAIIINSILKISPKIQSILNKINYKFYIALNNKITKNNYPSIFLIPFSLIKKLVNFQQEIKVISAGLYLGFIKRGKFYLSLEGAEFLLNMSCFSTNHKLFVNKNGEKSILYGNRILKRMITKIPAELKKNSFLLVFNLENELIALAISKVDYNGFQKLNPNDLVALNLTDKGYYLREKQ